MEVIVKTPLDVVVIGSGLIGLSTAMSLVTRNPDIRLTVIEKDSEISSQQSGLNSGVIHSGIYYKPGSMKSKFCVEGRSSMTKFCQENDIPVWTCGKLIVASSPKDFSRLKNLLERGKANNVEGLRLVEKQEIQEIEPHVRCDKGLCSKDRNSRLPRSIKKILGKNNKPRCSNKVKHKSDQGIWKKF